MRTCACCRVAYTTILLASASLAEAWMCNVTLEGSTSASQTLRTAIACTPGVSEQMQQFVASIGTTLDSSSVETSFEGNRAVDTTHAVHVSCLASMPSPHTSYWPSLLHMAYVLTASLCADEHT